MICVWIKSQRQPQQHTATHSRWQHCSGICKTTHPGAERIPPMSSGNPNSTDSAQFGFVRGGLDSRDRLADIGGFGRSGVAGNSLRPCRIFPRLASVGDGGFRVGSVGNEDLEECGSADLAGPRVLVQDVIHAGGDAFLDAVCGENFQPSDANPSANISPLGAGLATASRMAGSSGSISSKLSIL